VNHRGPVSHCQAICLSLAAPNEVRLCPPRGGEVEHLITAVVQLSLALDQPAFLEPRWASEACQVRQYLDCPALIGNDS
jgi:hypothetical protein